MTDHADRPTRTLDVEPPPGDEDRTPAHLFGYMTWATPEERDQHSETFRQRVQADHPDWYPDEVQVMDQRYPAGVEHYIAPPNLDTGDPESYGFRAGYRVYGESYIVNDWLGTWIGQIQETAVEGYFTHVDH